MPEFDFDTDSTEDYMLSGHDVVIANLLLESLEKESASDSDVIVVPPLLSGGDDLPRLFARPITDLPNEPYELIQPISVIIEELGPGEFIARFDRANIAMPGASLEEAFQNLVADILDTFEDLKGERSEMLGPAPRQQLAVLQRYLRSA